MLMQLPKGAGGFEIAGRRYVPDANGLVEVEPRDAEAAERHGAKRFADDDTADEPVGEPLPAVEVRAADPADPEPDGA